MNRRTAFILLFVVISIPCLAATPDVVEVDFLKHMNLDVNGAGPLLVKTDMERNRVVLVNTYTSSVSLIDGETHAVTNIPIKRRVPQYIKATALAIRRETGDIYLIGDKSIHIVFPDTKTALFVKTERQHEMVAVDEATGNAFFVGREDKRVGFYDLKKRKLKMIDCFDRAEPLANLNATPPPSIRKIACDSGLGKAFILDGYTRTLFSFSTETGRRLSERRLDLKEGARWHYGGYDADKHAMIVVIETDQRHVVQAARIDAADENDITVDLPGLTEGVGVSYSAARDEAYVPYDNHPAVHIVDFQAGDFTEVKIPAFGNDASAVDEERGRLYVTSWAYGEIDVIDLDRRLMVDRIENLGILPHMFSIALNGDELFVPLGATAVNGSFGAAVTIFSTDDFRSKKINTGWAPVDLIQVPGKESFLVFNSEDEYAEVFPDGSLKRHKLLVPYPRCAVSMKNDHLMLAYGPHQTYWPTVYIWASRNGFLELEPKPMDLPGGYSDFLPFDRRIPRLAHRVAVDSSGALWGLQNSWGREEWFLTCLPEGIRLFAPQLHVALDDTLQRETTPRILEYDEPEHKLYAVKIGEMDIDHGTLAVVDAATRTCLEVVETGRTPVDLAFDHEMIYVSNFDDNTITKIDKETLRAGRIDTGDKPLKLATADGALFVINHNDNTLQRLIDRPAVYKIPADGKPDNLFAVEDRLILTTHSAEAFRALSFDPEIESFDLLMEKEYPYGEVDFDTNNSSFYTRGQFGDGIFEVTRIKVDDRGRLWITDFLSGKLFILSQNENLRYDGCHPSEGGHPSRTHHFNP